MNKSDLIERIVEIGNLPRKRAEQVVNLIFDEMTAALARDERIEIRGFGSFVSKHYRARTGRNPRTGESIPVPAKRLPIFKVGKELRERVDYDGRAARGGGDGHGGDGVGAARSGDSGHNGGSE